MLHLSISGRARARRSRRQTCASRRNGGPFSWSTVLLVLVPAVFVTLPAAPSAGGDDATALPPLVTGPYRVRVGDQLTIDFFRSRQLTQSVTVGPDGYLYLPLIGRVTALDRTLEDLSSELVDRYGTELVDPQITVSVSEYSGLLVYVGGEVQQPGMLSYRGGLTLLQAIIDAGGFEPSARMKEVLLIRKREDNSAVGVRVDVKRILANARFEDDLRLAPADIIFVPRRRIANVNLFIQQYLTNNVPFSLFLGYSFD